MRTAGLYVIVWLATAAVLTLCVFLGYQLAQARGC
jgi:hypothetical protein